MEINDLYQSFVVVLNKSKYNISKLKPKQIVLIDVYNNYINYDESGFININYLNQG